MTKMTISGSAKRNKTWREIMSDSKDLDFIEDTIIPDLNSRLDNLEKRVDAIESVTLQNILDRKRDELRQN